MNIRSAQGLGLQFVLPVVALPAVAVLVLRQGHFI
jgi:hypothetical protein